MQSSQPFVRPPATPKEWQQYHDLHYRVLRQPLALPPMEPDAMSDAFVHGAAFEGDRLVSIARIKAVPEEPMTGQVRGVATEPEAHRKGYGRAVMAFIEEEARRQGYRYLYLNARFNAVDFYKTLGYNIEQDLGDYMPGVPHFRMGKTL